MRAHLSKMFQAGIDACHPRKVVPPHLQPAPAGGRIIVLALGKAAGEMAAAAEKHYRTGLGGVAVVPHGAAADLEQITLLHAGHPVPDKASHKAACALVGLARRAREDDLVLVLLSGGASALACLPGEGLMLKEKQALTAALLRSGAPIGEVNCVRRHLSGIKGGRLALAAARARLVTLAISDVPGDRPEDIGSGPTVADPTTIEEARAILAHRRVEPPGRGWSEAPDIPPSGYRIVARAADAIEAAAAEARRLGYRPIVLGECNGDAYATGVDHVMRALQAEPGTAFISGGELVTPHAAGGEGGRNHVYALAATSRLSRREGIVGLAADTDGLDGNSDAAGAFFDCTSRKRAGKDASEALENHLTGRYFRWAGDQFVTGRTGTNVCDLRIILVAH